MTRKRLEGKVAIITGATRGIGKCIAMLFAQEGAHVVIAAKSVEENPKIPGTIYSTAQEIEKNSGVETLAVPVDIREDAQVEGMVQETLKKWGRIDILINNAGALWWKPVLETPMKRYDLVNDINSRGTFLCTQAVLPHLLKQAEGGHILVFSPPIDIQAVGGKVAYCISKFGMTLLTHGLAQELQGQNISINSLWPVTAIESFATKNFQLGEESLWRKADILADASLALVLKKPGELTGEALLDEDVLRAEGVEDFRKYRCDPEKEPPRLDLKTISALAKKG
jgi:citronellol/citronellal dehydrogenase